MKKINLIWIVPLCVCIGYIFGLIFNLPHTITIDTGTNLEQNLNTLKQINKELNNKTCSYYNVTNINYNGYSDYSLLLGKINEINKYNERSDLIYLMCNDRTFCHCEDFNKRNVIIEQALNNTNNKFFLLSLNNGPPLYNDEFKNGFKEYQVRNIISKLNIDDHLEIFRFK